MTKLAHSGMASSPCRVVVVPETSPSSTRCVAYLELDDEAEVDAEPVISRLRDSTDEKDKNERQHVWARFDLWIRTVGHTKRDYFHGWDEEGFRECFVFKWNRNNERRRLYGFLSNPMLLNRRFQACVLVCYRTKNEHATDPRAKKLAARLRTDSRVVAALKMRFPDKTASSSGGPKHG